MRLCLVSRELAPFFGAGIGVYAAGAAAAWSEAGHETHVLTALHRDLRPSALRGVWVHATDTVTTPPPVSPPAADFQHHAWAVRAALHKLHRRHRFDYIEFPDYWAEGYYALRAARTGGHFPGAVLGVRLHTPTRLCRELNGEAPDPGAPRLEECEESAMAAADVLLSPTRSLMEHTVAALRARGLEAPPGEVIRYLFDAAAAARDLSADASAPPPALRPRVLYLGRLERRKGVELLVSSAAALLDDGIDAEFLFVGGDTATGPGGTSMLAHLRSLAAGRDRIGFEPARPRAALGALVRSAAVCCFPSLWENFPNVCLEAMSLGACVVGSDSGGMGEIVEDGSNGLLFRSGDAADLTRVLRAALAEPDLRRRLAHAAPARVRALCNPAVIVEETAAAIARASARPNRRAFVDAVVYEPSPLRVRFAAGLKGRLKGTALYGPLRALRGVLR